MNQGHCVSTSTKVSVDSDSALSLRHTSAERTSKIGQDVGVCPCRRDTGRVCAVGARWRIALIPRKAIPSRVASRNRFMRAPRIFHDWWRRTLRQGPVRGSTTTRDLPVSAPRSPLAASR